MENLVVTVLGNRNSGKSTTWNQLFRSEVRTGRHPRRLYLSEREFVEVFLISGSAEERELYVGEIIGNHRPRIVLCSVQYIPDSIRTFQFFIDNQYSIFCHWLNPGFSDSNSNQAADILGLLNRVLSFSSMLGIRNGKLEPSDRVQELRDFIHGWAASRGLIQHEDA